MSKKKKFNSDFRLKNKQHFNMFVDKININRKTWKRRKVKRKKKNKTKLTSPKLQKEDNNVVYFNENIKMKA